MTASARPELLRVSGDPAPGPHRVDSDDMWWWLPWLGPTATLLAHLLARHATDTGAGVTWRTDDLARRVGLGQNRSKLWASLERLDGFDVARFHAPSVMTVRLHMPELSSRQLARLPDDLARDYLRQHWPTGTGVAR